MEFEVTKMGERGQIVIPQEFRKNLGLRSGDKFIVIERAEVLILKRLQPPTTQEFETMLRRGHSHAKIHQLKEKDLEEAIRRARTKK